MMIQLTSLSLSIFSRCSLFFSVSLAPCLVGDLAVAVGIAVQPPCMEDDGAILGRRKRRCRVSFCTSG